MLSALGFVFIVIKEIVLVILKNWHNYCLDNK